LVTDIFSFLFNLTVLQFIVVALKNNKFLKGLNLTRIHSL